MQKLPSKSSRKIPQKWQISGKKKVRLIMKLTESEKYKTKEKDKLTKWAERLHQKLEYTKTCTSNSSSLSSAFKHNSTKQRSVKKVEKGLPKSPCKQSEVLNQIVSKCNIKNPRGDEKRTSQQDRAIISKRVLR